MQENILSLTPVVMNLGFGVSNAFFYFKIGGFLCDHKESPKYIFQ
jgi:hypothetical protein